jgi:hypothetical protein
MMVDPPRRRARLASGANPARAATQRFFSPNINKQNNPAFLTKKAVRINIR